MNAEQKRAWLAIGSLLGCAAGYAILAATVSAKVAPAALTLLAVNGFAGLIGGKEMGDPRDLEICRRASIAGFGASYLALILACMGLWFAAFAFGRRQTISVHTLAFVPIFGVAVLLGVRSLVILVLYGRQAKATDQ